MPRTNFNTLRDTVHARPGASERIAAMREHALAAMALYELRRSREISQEEVARRLNVTQSAVSRFERANDCLVSTVEDYARALGGHLEMRIRFDDEQPADMWAAPAAHASAELRAQASRKASQEQT